MFGSKCQCGRPATRIAHEVERLPAPLIGFAQDAVDLGVQGPARGRLIRLVELEFLRDGGYVRPQGFNQGFVCQLRGEHGAGKQDGPKRFHGKNPTPEPDAHKGCWTAT
jgi:hypothetical protein